MKRKLIVTGAHGFVAGSVLAQADDAWEVHTVSRTAETSPPPGVTWHICPSTSAGEINRLLESVRPAAVIHTAALADIDFCQAHPEAARAVNVDLTRELADACAKTRTRLVFCSTDTVFDGENAPYPENAATGPINTYAETKVAAEAAVRELGDLGVIARLSLVVGLPLLGAGNSFLVRMLAAFAEGRSVSVPAREVRTPVDVVTVGRALLELAGSERHGAFHLAGLSRVNRVELAGAIATRFGYNRNLVKPQPAEALQGRALRPRDVSMSAEQTRKALKTPFLTLNDGLSLIQNFAKKS